MYALIMAGGRGVRFWPRSRNRKPKHLLDIVTDRTIIQETVHRIKPLIPPRNIVIVTGKSHARELIRQLPEIPHENILIEPMGRNTAACIGYAAVHIQKRAKDAVMVVLPSDHGIGDPGHYREVIAAAAAAAQKKNALVTIGLKPDQPHTGFGYMEGGTVAGRVQGMKVLRVRSFREKPGLRQARSFLEKGNFFWNSGMFVWKTSVIMEEIKQFLPQLHAGLVTIAAGMGKANEASTVRAVYKNLSPISIDYGVMEKSKKVLMIPADFGWSDLGSWDTVWEMSASDENGNAATAGSQTVLEDTKNSFVYSPQKLVALIGMKDVIVVDTKDALLICKKGRSQDVKKVVDALEAGGKKHLL
jgi:mannose-1-phosphate guanylyltransferase